ncbi:MAG: DUF1223 domain-containing protein [Pseudomonadota bacterium]
MRAAIRILTATLVLLTSVNGAQAQSNAVLLELFTSQGCSSCPPADAYLNELAEDPDIVALSLHVDYWDYLGWRDAFASPTMTARQKGYAYARGSRSIFTPQMIVQGQFQAVGHNRSAIATAIEEFKSAPRVATITLTTKDGMLAITLAAQKPEAAKGKVHLVTYAHPQTLQVFGGENRGRSITYANVAKSWMTLGTWDGEPVTMTAPLPSMMRGVAVFVQNGDHGPIIAAAKLEM